MKPKTQHRTTEEPEPEPESEIPFKDDTEICQQLMSRYSTSTAPHHRHLLATAAAIRSILAAESLPLTYPAYFAGAIHNLSNYKSLDSTAVSALLSFVSILAPLIPEKEIKGDKAKEAVGVLVEVVGAERRGGLGVATVGGVVKCLGVLILGFCDLEDWGSIKEGFETLLKFSVDKRPKVRRSAQDSLEKVFRSFRSSHVIKEASKLVFSLVKSCMPVALRLSESRIIDGSSKDETLSKPEHLEVLHMLNLLKVTIQYLSVKISSKILLELLKLMGSSHYTALTRHVFKIIEAFFETWRDEVIGLQIESIINYLCLYVSLGEKNPVDTVILAATLLKIALDKLHAGGSSSWMRNFPKVCGPIAGLLTCEAGTASQASDVLKELINRYMDQKILLINIYPSFEDANQESKEADVIKSTCAIFENTLSSCDAIPNEHLLGVISVLFHKLGEMSYVFMKTIVLKLANLMNHAGQGVADMNHLQDCIGSAVVAMGPEKLLTLIPISIDADELTCSNIWLVPILKKHVVGASLGYYMDQIVPLAKSFHQASCKVKNSVIGQDLQGHGHGLWGLLPSFCRYPVDCHKKFGSLAELVITLLKKDSFMHQSIAVALQVLVNQNRSILISKNDGGDSNNDAVKDSVLGHRKISSYSKKTATRNIKALASYSTELLQALAELFVDAVSEKRLYIKDAIGCFASITDSSITKRIFVSLLERFQFVDSRGEFEKLETRSDELVEKEGNLSVRERDGQRCVMMELASYLIVGAKEDLINLIYNFIVYIFQAAGVTGHCEAYHTLSRILEEHAWFCSSRFVELIDLLFSLKPPADVASLRYRFACFQVLLVHSLEISLEDENPKGFLILNEIILTLKDATDDARKVAYDVLLMLSSSLRNSSCTSTVELYHKLISMIMGYLSGSSPHIKSGAVSALSVLLYNDTKIFLKMPDLVPSLLSLLQSKAVEVIKAVLGFAKVLVSCLQAEDLQNLLSDILNGVLPWSSVSRNHFRSKVTIILEIMTRKCGSAAVELVTPEKYKSFLKTVLQNRHHKSASKEAGITDVEPTVANSSNKGSVPVKNGAVHLRKRKTEKKQNEGPPGSRASRLPNDDDGGHEGAKRARHSKHKNPMDGLSKDGGKKRNFNKKSLIGGKRKMEQKKMSKTGEVVFHRPGSASKLRKPKKVGKKQKVSN